MNNIIRRLHVQPLTEEERTRKGILARLAGPIASCSESTRNGHRYNRSLWEKALADGYMEEQIKNKALFLELGHPEERTKTDMREVCACIPTMPQIEGDDLITYVDVLDTPNGRILKTLLDYGFIPGISSRGTGDLNGEDVDPETFMLETWDIVQVPALEKARLQIVESLQNGNLKKALTEELDKASVNDRKIMESALHNLKINITTTDNDSVNINNSNKTLNESKEANDDGTNELVKSLQEALKEKSKLEAQLKSLQEQLAVRDTKVNELTEEVSNYKSTTARLSDVATNSKMEASKVSELEESLKKAQKQIELLKNRNSKLVEAQKVISANSKTLNESTEKAKVNLNEQLLAQKADFENQIAKLKESLTRESNEKNIASKKLEESQKQLTEANKSVNNFKRVINETMTRYINFKAKTLGISKEEIINKLPNTYSLDDVDKICEDLQVYNLNISKLPFNVQKGMKVKITESQSSPFKQKSDITMDDDYIDESLLQMAGYFKN